MTNLWLRLTKRAMKRFCQSAKNGFLTRVKERGMVCGWAPQVEVLAHNAIKGFVSHYGWNSILESLWHGVPIATWPLNAEQHMNSFLMVKELGLAVELSLTYRSSGSELVMAYQIERAINCLIAEKHIIFPSIYLIASSLVRERERSSMAELI